MAQRWATLSVTLIMMAGCSLSILPGEWSELENVTSIPHELEFPDYDQHSTDECAVGCGPVAWAMVFGYLDRRSHLHPNTYGTGSQGLFRDVNGSDAAMAPRSGIDISSRSEIDSYTDHLNDVMGTWCVASQGLTLMSHMERVRDFYKDRQGLGLPRIRKRWSWSMWLGIYQEFISRWSREQIDQGWPVIIGYRHGMFSWHYPVVTKYGRRTRQVPACRRQTDGDDNCDETETEVGYMMYLHMGWGGSKNGWYPMESFFAITATY